MTYHKWLISVTLVAFFIVTAPSTARSEEADRPEYIKPNLDEPLYKAAAEGSLSDLRTVVAKSPYPQMRQFAQAELDRSHWQLKSSADQAKACFDSSFSPELMTMALGCASAWMSSAILGGDLAEQERRAGEIRRRLYPVLSKARNGKDVRDRSFEPQLPDAAALPPYSLHVGAEHGRIPAELRHESSGRMYMTTIVINNVPIQALVDTGTTRSVLNKHDASKVGARLIPGAKRFAGPTENGNSDVSMGVGVVAEVKWGSLVVKNYAASIWDGPFSTVGLDLIGALPAPLRLTDKSISYGDSGMPKTCASALALGGSLSGFRTRVFLSGSINGLPDAPLYLDTGASGSLNGYDGSKIPMPTQLGTVNVLRGGTLRAARSGFTDVSLNTGGKSLPVHAMRFIDEASDQPDVIGSGILDGHSIWLDFPREHACVD